MHLLHPFIYWMTSEAFYVPFLAFVDTFIPILSYGPTQPQEPSPGRVLLEPSSLRVPINSLRGRTRCEKSLRGCILAERGTLKKREVGGPPREVAFVPRQAAIWATTHHKLPFLRILPKPRAPRGLRGRNEQPLKMGLRPSCFRSS